MNETYLLVLGNGKRYEGISLDEVKRILFDECHYSYAYVKHLIHKAKGRDCSPVEISWVPGRNMNYQIAGIQMGYKTALFDLQWRGHTKEQAECLLRCAEKLAKARETRETLEELENDGYHENLLRAHFAECLRAMAKAS